MRRLLRVILKTLKWTGLALSTLLLAGIVVLWVRSVGYVETWAMVDFEPHPEWADERFDDGWCIRRFRTVEAIHGRLWLRSETSIHRRPAFPEDSHERSPITTPDDAASFQFAYWFHRQEETRDAVVHRVWSFAGLGYSHMSQTCDPVTARDALDAYTLAFPMWMLAAIFAVWPVGFVSVRFLRKQCRARNLCPACGYDLRATPDPAGTRLARCPECGRAVVRHASR